MPVRSLTSSVLRWPDAATVLEAARRWAENLAAHEPAVSAVGCFGSYARGEAGVGSDLDLLAIVRDGCGAGPAAGGPWAVEDLPVPADLLTYTASQWRELRRGNGRFYRTLCREARWLAGEPPEPA